jgi:hypothetical protein
MIYPLPMAFCAKRRINALVAATALVAAVVLPATGFAQSDAKILTISGKISKANTPEGKYVFSFAELQKLGDTRISSTTRFTEVGEFAGPKIRDILSAVGAARDATAVSVVASDGYQQTIPLTDFQKWGVIMAHTLNGNRLTVENNGPLWIMYPIDRYPDDLMNSKTMMKLVWNVTGLVVK